LADRFQVGATFATEAADGTVQQQGLPENKELEDLLSGWALCRPDEDGNWIAVDNLRDYLAWGLAGNQPPLKTYLSTEQRAGRSLTPNPLPPGSAGGGLFLSVDDDQASVLRAALFRRHDQALRVTESDMPVPRFGQGEGDVYVILPFIRVLGECDCEYVVWGPRSQRFRVASPLDPEAARPVNIVLPSLKSLTRGRPKASFTASGELAAKLARIMPDKGLTPDLIATDAACNTGLCWIFSFSIPAITICALIVLMIVLNLLNLIFWWLPWVFLRLPVLCKRLLP
jgi:hypothetical protein